MSKTNVLLSSAPSPNRYRARDLHDADFPVRLFDNIEPADVLQGGLGNCWLMAACSTIAEYPDYITGITFKDTEVRWDGKYVINL